MEVEGCRKPWSYMIPRLKRTFLGDLSLFLPPSPVRDFSAVYSQSPWESCLGGDVERGEPNGCVLVSSLPLTLRWKC